MCHYAVAVDGIQACDTPYIDVQSVKLVSHTRFIRKDDSDHGKAATADLDTTFGHVADKGAMGLLK